MSRFDEDRKKSSHESKLESRYGKIGISAVAAAVRYQSESTNPAYAPARESRSMADMTDDMDAAA
jgi:hypothetical protein